MLVALNFSRNPETLTPGLPEHEQWQEVFSTSNLNKRPVSLPALKLAGSQAVVFELIPGK
jgi:hypothetical protein